MSSSVLIVDDEEHIRRVMRLALEASGYEVGEAGSGEEALERMAEDPRWAVVVLDERMPGIDGLETLRRMRELETGAAVVMATAFASVELAVDAMKLGATDFLRKPMSPDTLRTAVSAALTKGAGTPAGAPPAPRLLEGGQHYEAWTMNGFRLHYVSGSPDAREYRFEVRHGQVDAPHTTLVRVESQVVSAVERSTQKPLAGDAAFWRQETTRALIRYLWSESKLPPDGVLTIDEASGKLLDAAYAWKGSR